MKKKTVVTPALASAISLAFASAAAAQKHPERPTYKFEKCYGIARAGHNDCFSRSNSCGGTSTEDGQKDAWIFVPEGTCAKIVGGVLDKRSGKEDKDGDKPRAAKEREGGR